jgi:hypothetical protein
VTGTSFPFNGLVFNQGGDLTGKNMAEAMPDGTENTILFATGAIQSDLLRDASADNPTTCNITGVDLPQFRDWYPGGANLALFQAYYSGGIAVCMGNSETRWVSPQVSARSWQAAMIPDDKLVPGEDF